MRLFLASAGLLLIAAVPARAQSTIGGGSIGHVSFPSVLNVPPTEFKATVESGSRQGFVPTAYVSFDQGVERGRAVVAAAHRSVGEAAEANSRETRPKAKVVFAQTGEESPIIVRR